MGPKVGWGGPLGGSWLSWEVSAEQMAPDRWRRQWECFKRGAGQICSRWSQGGGPSASRREKRKGWGGESGARRWRSGRKPPPGAGCEGEAGRGLWQPRGPGCQGSWVQAPPPWW